MSISKTRLSHPWLARLTALAAVAVAAVAAATGCSAGGSTTESPCESEPVDRFKELIVVDDAVVNDARALNGTSGPWSFHHTFGEMAPSGVDAGEFVRSWLVDWVNTKDVNGFPLDSPNEERVAGMNKYILCPWLKRTPANACNEDCSTCAGQKLDLASAPFRLIGISNRLDLRETIPDLPSGESRFVYALTDGAADDPASRPLAMTVIAEFKLPPTRSTAEWARTWHDLGKFPAFDESYRAGLQALTDAFSSRGSNPAGANGSAIGQVRTNESVLDWIWQEREFGLDDSGMLRLKPLWNTPAAQFNDTRQLADFVSANAADVRAGKYQIPVAMRSASSDALRYSWTLPGVDDATSRAFAQGTCNGCHTEHANVDTAFHISPFRTGISRVSAFLNDPSGAPDELQTRTASLRRALCNGS